MVLCYNLNRLNAEILVLENAVFMLTNECNSCFLLINLNDKSCKPKLGKSYDEIQKNDDF